MVYHFFTEWLGFHLKIFFSQIDDLIQNINICLYLWSCRFFFVSFNLWLSSVTEITLCLVFQDLSRLGRDLAQVVIIDNSPASYIFHPDNAVSSVSVLKCFTLLYRITVCCYHKYARKDLAMYHIDCFSWYVHVQIP